VGHLGAIVSSTKKSARRKAPPARAGAGVPREFYDDAIRQRDAANDRADRTEERLLTVVAELTALKKHDFLAAPETAQPPVEILGPLTLLAIEDAAGGDQELQNRLLVSARATWRAAAKQKEFDDPTVLDHELAARIAAGDQD
jgi:hypothetical protein